ncbi:hypothetical protein APY03_0855 [Variovorax sp. WDL1]|nr:hypothetical protein APY03_0855 [Variovorax sp. WDL1]
MPKTAQFRQSVNEAARVQDDERWVGLHGVLVCQQGGM